MIDTDKKALSYYNYERLELLELVPAEATRILDVGCGAGILGENIKKRQNALVYGVEPEHKAAELAATKLDHVWACPIEEALEEIADDTLDCVIVADVLEHLVDPWSVLKQLQKKLNNGGKIVASIPNVQHWSVAKRLLEGSWQYETMGLLDISHIRFFTRRSLYELFCTAGLRIANITYTTNGGGASKIILSALEKAGIKTDSLAQDSNVFQYLVVAERIAPIEETPKVSIIVLNWNGLNDTLECLESVKKIDYPNFEIIVVDNGSTDGSPQRIREQFPDITVIETGKNLGFAEGNNVGIRHALAGGADYLFVLNNDTIVDPQVLHAFLEKARLYPEAGILGGKVYYHAVPAMIWNAGCRRGITGIDFSFIGMRQVDDGISFDKIYETDYVIGCAMFISSQVARSIGLFEKKFFLCWEEIDFCTRALKKGFKNLYVPQARIWHKIGASLGEMESPMRAYFDTRNQLLWAKRNLSFRQCFELYKKTFRDLFPRLSLNGNKAYHTLPNRLYWALLQYKREFLKRYNDPVYKAKLWGVRDYFLGRFGDCPAEVRALKRSPMRDGLQDT